MNPDPIPAVNPPPETTSPGRPADTEGARQKKPGLLRRIIHIGQWLDRGLDLEGRDTSDWNIYYYYFRQVAQHHAQLKLKHLKWIALLFQLYFFGLLALTILRGLFLLDGHFGGNTVKTAHDFFQGFASMLGVSANIYILPVLLFIPVFMVCPAFRLRNKAQGFMTSRAKDPPLLAHLVQYTTNKGLVQGVLLSLLYTWKRLILLLLPCIVVTVLMLIGFTAVAPSEEAFKLAFGVPLGAALAVPTLSLFFVMQPFCYRLDSLMVIIGVAVESVVLLPLGFLADDITDFWVFWVFFTACYVPSCLFACVYFPLAAADTGEYGLGKRASKWIRILYYSMAGVFLALLLSMNAFPSIQRYILGKNEPWAGYFDLLFTFATWGLFVIICCLLVTSISITSPLAERQRRLRAKVPFLRKLFDPASPVSLIPVLALELIGLVTISEWLQPFIKFMDSGRFLTRIWVQTARVVWTALHIGLVFVYVYQRRKPERKEPWNFNVRFNMTTIICGVLFQLMTLLDFNGVSFSSILYILSLIILFCVFIWLRFRKSASDDVTVPPTEQNKEAS